MPPDNRPPRLGSDTLRSRARASGQIAEAKSQTRQRVAERFETQDPEDVPVALDEGRLQPTSGFLDMARPMEAAAEFDPQFPRQDVGPDDVRETDKGFAPAEDVQRQKAAFEFEEETPLDDVDPQRGVAKQGGGFGLATPARRRLGAIRLDDQFPQQDLSADDVKVTDDGVRPEEDVQRRKAARELTQQTPLSNIDPFAGIQQTNDGFALSERNQEKIQKRQQQTKNQQIQQRKQQLASELDDNFMNIDVQPQNITRRNGRFVPDRALESVISQRRFDLLLEDVDVAGEDLKFEDGSFAPTQQIKREQIAADIDPQLPDVDVGVGDITRDGDVFVPTEGVRKQQAAEAIDPQLPDVDVGVGDITRDGETYTPTQNTIRQQAARDIDPQIPSFDVGVGDITRRDEGFGLTQGAQREATAEQIESETPLTEVNPTDDLKRDDGQFQLTSGAAERLFNLDPDFTF